MPLSSVLGAQSLVRPGVCTSSTRPASPFEGQVIYETDTDLVQVYNGSGWKALGRMVASANGSVLQVVQGTTTTEVSTTSTSYVTTNITASITPSSTSNKVLVNWSCVASKDTTNFSVAEFSLFRGTVSGTNLGTVFWYDVDAESRGTVGFSYIDSPNTTSSQTYTVGIKTNSASTTVVANKSSALGTITLMEIAG
jgi:hypothetical protein